jgi:hypothetical protein
MEALTQFVFLRPPIFIFFHVSIFIFLFLFFLKQYNRFFFRKVEHQTNGAAFYLVLDAHIKLPPYIKSPTSNSN